MSKTITSDQHRRIIELSTEGYGTQDISKLVGVGETAVLKYSRLPLEDLGEDSVAGHRLYVQLKDIQAKYKAVLEEKILNQRYEDFIATIASRKVHIPKWTKEPRANAKRQGIPTAFLSDTHFDEIVDPKQIEFLNAYDRPIAEARTKNFFSNTVEVCKEYWSGINYPGIVMPMGGDIFTGAIHEELLETNAAYMMDSVLHWLEPLGAGLKMFADAFGHVLVPVCVGNHPRMSRKPRHKGRVRDNFDWLFARLLERDFSKDPEYRGRVHFLIGESSDVKWSVYGTRYRMTHGDQARGGSGIAGALSPLMILDARKKRRAQKSGDPHDIMLVAHWHQLMFFKDMIINGSLKGYDEYCYHGNFDFEAPRQGLWITDPDPRKGVCFTTHVRVQSSDEPWPVVSHEYDRTVVSTGFDVKRLD